MTWSKVTFRIESLTLLREQRINKRFDAGIDKSQEDLARNRAESSDESCLFPLRLLKALSLELLARFSPNLVVQARAKKKLRTQDFKPASV